MGVMRVSFEGHHNGMAQAPFHRNGTWYFNEETTKGGKPKVRNYKLIGISNFIKKTYNLKDCGCLVDAAVCSCDRSDEAR